MKVTRVLIADDHAILRSGLRLLLEKEPDLKVAGEATNGREAIECLAHELVDIVVMDVGMPGLNGMEATDQIKRKYPSVGVVVLSMHRDETYVLRCLRAGARGYVLKESAESELRSSLTPDRRRTWSRGGLVTLSARPRSSVDRAAVS